MDEPTAPSGALRDPIARREAELLRSADVVFTAGPSLYRKKRALHPNVHCFPSSVDASHFRSATNGLADAPDQAALPGPRLGFYGVIGERLDRELLDAVASSHPEWQIVLVGPLAQGASALLPARPNLHYLGARSYQDLPSYLAGWDVCLLPCTLGESTRYANPTKILEYMAAERPIVATAIPDVVERYAEVVQVGDGPDGFVAACERALAETAEQRAARVARVRAMLRRTSWDSTLERMLGELRRAMHRSGVVAPSRGAAPLRAAASALDA